MAAKNALDRLVSLQPYEAVIFIAMIVLMALCVAAAPFLRTDIPAAAAAAPAAPAAPGTLA